MMRSDIFGIAPHAAALSAVKRLPKPFLSGRYGNVAACRCDRQLLERTKYAGLFDQRCPGCA